MGRPAAPRYCDRPALLAAAQAVARKRLEAMLGEPWRDAWTAYFKVSDEAIELERRARRLIANEVGRKGTVARRADDQAAFRKDASFLPPHAALLGTTLLLRNGDLPKRRLPPLDNTAGRTHLVRRVRAGLPNHWLPVNRGLRSLTTRGLAYVSLLVGHAPGVAGRGDGHTVDEIVDLEERAMHVAEVRHRARGDAQSP
jgi:hypothetical protein